MFFWILAASVLPGAGNPCTICVTTTTRAIDDTTEANRFMTCVSLYFYVRLGSVKFCKCAILVRPCADDRVLSVRARWRHRRVVNVAFLDGGTRLPTPIHLQPRQSSFGEEELSWVWGVGEWSCRRVDIVERAYPQPLIPPTLGKRPGYHRHLSRTRDAAISTLTCHLVTSHFGVWPLVHAPHALTIYYDHII